MPRLNRKQFMVSAWNRLKGMLLLPGMLSVPIMCKASGDNGGTGLDPAGKLRGESGGFEPGYLKLHRNGELKNRGEELWERMRECSLCPRECDTDRLAGEEGDCGSNARIKVASYNPHRGEEDPLSGRRGSGTIFMSNCSLRCVFCLNWQISHGGKGRYETPETVAGMMLKLQEMGCHNINIVTPTHYSPHLLLALDIAAARGLRLPLVYNTSGWEKVEILKYLDGVVDIYLPDFKYWNPEMAAKYSDGADEYPELAKQALLEMQRQVGTAHPAADGLMYRGLMVRHLVMPNSVSGSSEVVRWIAGNLPKDTYLNIMSQYRPMYKASKYREINRRTGMRDYRAVVRKAKDAGLTNLDIQGEFWF